MPLIALGRRLLNLLEIIVGAFIRVYKIKTVVVVVRGGVGGGLPLLFLFFFNHPWFLHFILLCV